VRSAPDTRSMLPGRLMCCSICGSRSSGRLHHDNLRWPCTLRHGRSSQPSLSLTGAALPSALEYTSTASPHASQGPSVPLSPWFSRCACRALRRDEVLLMQQLRHPHVLQFLCACMRPPSLAMVTEHMPQSLHHVLYNTTTVVDTKRCAGVCVWGGGSSCQPGSGGPVVHAACTQPYKATHTAALCSDAHSHSSDASLCFWHHARPPGCDASFTRSSDAPLCLASATHCDAQHSSKTAQHSSKTAQHSSKTAQHSSKTAQHTIHNLADASCRGAPPTEALMHSTHAYMPRLLQGGGPGH
jgi:hypothetical protein